MAQTDALNGDDEELSGGGSRRDFTITVPAEAAGSRLDSFLASRVSSTSRSQIRRAIELGGVTVDGRQVAKPAYDLAGGELIEMALPESRPIEAVAEPIPLDIVYEDDELLVVNKPSGMVTHPGAGILSGTLANGLVHHLNLASRELPRRGGASRPGIVHRLDVGTSGLIVVAKTDPAHLNLANQFQSRTVYKSYIALVYGSPAEESGTISAPIGRDPRSRVRMAVVRENQGRAALTLYRVERRYGDFTLLDVEIKTGRTHQIRVHLAHIRHPIVGDSTYGGGRLNSVRSARIRAAIERLDRPFLHAARLCFDHPATGERMEFTAPLPADLRMFLDLLGQTQP